jgi:hypothetical protein
LKEKDERGNKLELERVKYMYSKCKGGKNKAKKVSSFMATPIFI